jgi:hypothetical protein
MGNAEQQQANADGDPKAAVDDRLHEQVAADAMSGFVERFGGNGKTAMADEADEVIAQIATLEAHEHYQHHPWSGSSQDCWSRWRSHWVTTEGRRVGPERKSDTRSRIRETRTP